MKPNFTKKTLITLLAIMMGTGTSAQMKFKDGSIPGSSCMPVSGAILELESINKGLLLPRVSLSNTTTWGLAGSAIEGMEVYNASASITSSNTNYPISSNGEGIYYWDGTGWVSSSAPASYQHIKVGNATTNSLPWSIHGHTTTFIDSVRDFTNPADQNYFNLMMNIFNPATVHTGIVSSYGGGLVTMGATAINSALASANGINNLNTNTTTSALGVMGSIMNLSTGNITTAKAFDVNVQNAGGGNIVTAVGYNVGVVGGNTAIGVYIEDNISATGSGFAIKSDAIEPSSFTGKIGIGVTTPTANIDINAPTGYNQLRLRSSYTPTGTADANGNTGDVAWDDNYMYIKTSAGWKRTSLSSF